MMRFDRFTEKAQRAAQYSADIIQRYGHNQIDTEHLLLALVEQLTGSIPKILEKLKVNPDVLIERLDATLRASPKVKIAGAKDGQIFITPRVKRIIDLANDEAYRLDDDSISTEHIFLSILTERNTPASRILEAAGLKRDKVYAALKDIRESQMLENTESRTASNKAKPFDKVKSSTNRNAVKKDLTKNNKKVFIVHGHDEAMKLAVARTIEKLGLDAIVLHEKPNHGKTIIEKFTEYSDVGFAVVLLSPDDISLSIDGAVEKRSFRARQNVIFELGFFIGKLGRNRVISIFRQADGFEFPSDYSGVLFVAFDSYNHWRFDLIRELRASGYKVDANKLLE